MSRFNTPITNRYDEAKVGLETWTVEVSVSLNVTSDLCCAQFYLLGAPVGRLHTSPSTAPCRKRHSRLVFRAVGSMSGLIHTTRTIHGLSDSAKLMF